MVFTSFNFLIFFPAVIVIYYILPKNFRWVFLLVASYFFYINISPVYTLLLAGVTTVTYLFTRWIEKTETEKKKKLIFLLGIILTLFPLFFFKYFDFLNQSIFALLSVFGLRWPLPKLGLLLPVGISFYTFMALGYLIDVYNENIEAEKNPGIVALFLSFFPIVLSGPIERAGNMFSQFKAKTIFNYKKAVKGLQLILWGYFMKLVIADRLAIYLSAIFSNSEHHSGTSLLFATLLYPIQVYGDLGGYSLIAIGCANVMGIDIIPNFKRPFFSTSMSEFWRRWHLSLITWLIDYVYTPISFSLRKFKVWGIVIALMLTFFISGVWHGAALTFIIWGLIQGAVLSIDALLRGKRVNIENRYALKNKWWYTLFCCMITYVIFAFSLIFGGAVDSVSKTLEIIGKIFTDSQSLFIDDSTLVYSFTGIILLFLSDFRDEFFPDKFKLFENENILIRWGAYLSISILIILIGVFNGGQFIYFQF